MGQMPIGCERLEAARAENPDARVWRGDLQMELSQRGIVILGTPVGTPEFVQQQLEQKVVEHEKFLHPQVDGPPMCLVAPLVLRRCSGEFLTISPALSHSVATRHDAQIWRCLSTLVGLGPDAVCDSAKITASLPLAGGLGFRSATKLRCAVHWASYTIKMVNERHPEVAERRRLTTVTMHPASRPSSPVKPVWRRLVSAAQCGATSPVAEPKPNRTTRISWSRTNPGWAKAAREVESLSFEGVMDLLHDPQKALLRSQGGPLASAPFVAMPVDRMCRIESQTFRILLLRRLRQPLPLTEHSCRCGRLLDSFGHLRSACLVAGVLWTRGFPHLPKR